MKALLLVIPLLVPVRATHAQDRIPDRDTVGLGVYFNRDFSSFGLLDSPSFVFNMQANLWIGGVRLGRSIRFGESRFGLNTEVSFAKILGTCNKFSSNRPLVDGLGVTQRLYDTLNQEVGTRLRQSGFLPTFNLLLTYRIGRQR